MVPNGPEERGYRGLKHAAHVGRVQASFVQAVHEGSMCNSSGSGR